MRKIKNYAKIRITASELQNTSRLRFIAVSYNGSLLGTLPTVSIRSSYSEHQLVLSRHLLFYFLSLLFQLSRFLLLFAFREARRKHEPFRGSEQTLPSLVAAQSSQCIPLQLLVPLIKRDEVVPGFVRSLAPSCINRSTFFRTSHQ